MSWQAQLSAALGASIAAVDPVTGGDINDAHRVRLTDGRLVFVKSHRTPPDGMFAAEAAGLDWLRAASELRIPRVLAIGERWLALEWLELGDPATAIEQLGRGLAQLHQIGAPRFGFEHDNFLATLAQDNRAEPDWPTFYVERRLRPLVTLGLAHGRIPDVRGRLDALRDHPDRFGPPELPARLHGDLWWGNVAACEKAIVLIDPAVYGGHREIDLAMLALFGGLPDRAIAAYTEVFPLADGWRGRVALHQLYPIAAHAVLFGGGYGAQLERMLVALT